MTQTGYCRRPDIFEVAVCCDCQKPKPASAMQPQRGLERVCLDCWETAPAPDLLAQSVGTSGGLFPDEETLDRYLAGEFEGEVGDQAPPRTFGAFWDGAFWEARTWQRVIDVLELYADRTLWGPLNQEKSRGSRFAYQGTGYGPAARLLEELRRDDV